MNANGCFKYCQALRRMRQIPRSWKGLASNFPLVALAACLHGAASWPCWPLRRRCGAVRRVLCFEGGRAAAHTPSANTAAPCRLQRKPLSVFAGVRPRVRPKVRHSEEQIVLRSANVCRSKEWTVDVFRVVARYTRKSDTKTRKNTV